MRRALVSLVVVIGSIGAAVSGCGSSRDGYADAPPGGLGGSTDPNAPFADGGGGAGTPLSCKGLHAGTKSSAGCDYYAVVPDVILDGAGACFAAFITNTWTEPVTITVDYGGMTLDASKFSYI